MFLFLSDFGAGWHGEDKCNEGLCPPSDAKPEVFKNAPLCLQLVGRRNADDQLLAVLEKINEVLPLSA